MNTVKYILRNLIDKKTMKGILVLLVLGLIISMISLAPGYLMGRLINEFNNGAGHQVLYLVAGLMISSYFLIEIIRGLEEKYDIKNVTFNFIEKFQENTLIKLNEKQLPFFLKNHTGEQINEIDKGFNALTNLIFNAFFWIIPTVMTVAIATIFLLVLYPIFGLITLSVVIIYGISIYSYWKLSNPKLRRWQKTMRKQYGAHTDLIRNTVEIKIAGADEMHDRYLSQIHKVHKHGKKMHWWLYLISLPAKLIVIIGITIILLLGIKMISSKTLLIGDLVVILTWFGYIKGNLSQGTQMMRRISSGVVLVVRLVNMLQEESEETSGDKKVWLKKGHISFSNVSFSYKGKEGSEDINNISLEFKPGELTSIIGPSGSGKSTLFKLLLQGVSPQKGEILVDGTNLKDVDSRIYYDQISYIPQEKTLFNCSLRLNLLLGIKEDIDDVRINEVLDNLGLSKLKSRLSRDIGENGKNLSGGERQRVLFARAVLQETKNLILMDEPTSDLDAESEKIIREVISEFKKAGKMIIMIAHRLTIVQDSDSIFVLKDGEIVSRGNHESLLSNCSTYKRMVSSQSITS